MSIQCTTYMTYLQSAMIRKGYHFTNLKGESHGHPNDIIHVISSGSMRQISECNILTEKIFRKKTNNYH